MDNEIIKCNICGHILISGINAICIFTEVTKIQCLKCGNKYVFGKEIERLEIEK